MADKNMDSQALTSTMMAVIESTLANMNGISPSEPPQSGEKDIVECYGRLRVDGVSKFNSASYISVINYYLTEAEVEKPGKAKGALVLYVEVENAGKLYKALGIPFPEDEDNASMMECCGKFCDMLASGLKSEIANLGYVDLVMSPSQNYRSTIMDGVEFSKDQKKLVEFSFFYWKKKAIVVELSLAAIPTKK